MSNPSFVGLSEMTQARKVRVAIRADGADYEGYVDLDGDGTQVHDLLNDPRPFLTLTEVVLHDRSFSYVALNKGAITHLMVLEVLAAEGTAQSASASPQTPPAGLSPAALAAARQPTVPPAGPSTLPAPPPRPVSGDPPTQPFPKESIGPRASDLDDDDDILLDEDDGDDIDPDDLERDVGALITGSGR